MDVFRFDPEVSVPIDHLGSRFRVGPLTGPDSRVRVQVLHLAPGGLVARHPTAVRQLFAVIAGEATVSGGDARPRTLTAGHAALWAEGEDHDARSDTGCTAVVIEGTFAVWATAVTKDIVVADHDPAWADWFRQLHDRIWPVIADVALRIDHVGSTSVPGLAAKPVIDMDIVVADESRLPPVIEALRPLGYVWRGNLGVEGREAFLDAGDARDLPDHNLYAVVEGNRAHLDHVLLRDLLREDREACERYAALKRANVALADRDMDVYVAAKATLVAELLARARTARGLEPVEYWRP